MIVFVGSLIVPAFASAFSVESASLRTTLILGIVACGALAMRWAIQYDRGFVRFVYDHENVAIEWHRGGKVRRTERLSRADLIDVAIDDEPSSGTTVSRVVIGTRLGDIPLSESTSSIKGPYEDAAHRIHMALGIPIRG